MSLRTKVAAYYASLMEDRPYTGMDGIVLSVLKHLGVVYEKGVRAKYHSYKNNEKAAVHLPAVIISLGNITVGGTGKTPTACLLARQLQAQGLRVALLNRGYQSPMEHKTAIVSDGKKMLLPPEVGGDESYLMARLLPNVPVIVGRDRSAAGKLAIDRFSSQVLLLDDGYQHWQLARDLDIVLVDATNPFGNGHLLPGGILREPLEHLDRAGLFLITKAEGKEPAAIDAIRQTLRRYNHAAPIAVAVQSVKWCVPFTCWEENKRDGYVTNTLQKDTAVLAVSALGNPLAFEGSLRQAGYRVHDTARFDDHHYYTETELECLVKQARETGCTIVTTEKDAVKFPAAYIKKNDLPIYVLGIEIEIISGREAFDAAIDHALGGIS